jgi:hypothetical protein
MRRRLYPGGQGPRFMTVRLCRSARSGTSVKAGGTDGVRRGSALPERAPTSARVRGGRLLRPVRGLTTGERAAVVPGLILGAIASVFLILAFLGIWAVWHLIPKAEDF